MSVNNITDCPKSCAIAVQSNILLACKSCHFAFAIGLSQITSFWIRRHEDAREVIKVTTQADENILDVKS